MARSPRTTPARGKERRVDSLTHDEAARLNVPTAEMASLFEQREEILGEGEREMRMHWQNRMILGDSFQVMASLAERKRMRGKVQCIYSEIAEL